MRQEDLGKLFLRDPFPVLRLHLTGGRTFDISDPDDIALGRSTIEFLIPGEKGREAVISLLHIIWLEVILTDA